MQYYFVSPPALQSHLLPEKFSTSFLFPPSYLLPGLPIRWKIYMMKIAHSIKCFNKQLLKKTGAA